MSTRPARHVAVLLHRWVGLTIAAFVVVTAATGSLIAFYDEIEAWLLPELLVVAPPRDAFGAAAPMLDPLALRDRIAARYPQADIDWVDLHREPGRAQTFGLGARPGQPALANDEVFVDPYRGTVLGERKRGDLSQGWRNAMPFVYALHDSLAAGEVGRIVLGIAALLWTADCFVGLALTLPLTRRNAPVRGVSSPPSWAARWAPAWRVRWRSSARKVVFDVHRALSLWTWGALLVLAWSAVGFNLGEVYRPVMQVFGYAPPDAAVGAPAPAAPNAPMGWADALATARGAMSAEAAARGFGVIRERSIARHAERGTYEYRTLSTLDVGRKLGNTTLFIDDRTGRVVSVDLPTGRGTANTVDTWIANLHTASVGGLTMQIVLCAMGIFVVVVTVTGVEIWRERFVARRRRRAT